MTRRSQAYLSAAQAVVRTVTLAWSLALSHCRAADTVDFNFQIRPLLSDRCFNCHGPDEKARKGRLRLDNAESAMAPRGLNGRRHAIVPGDLEASELWRRINSTDPDDQMPPPESKLSLNEDERGLLRRWIVSGAAFAPHWSFAPLSVPALPVAALATNVHPIDAWIRARLRVEGLQPAPPAPREQLLRRLSLDLTGLPPSLAELDAFLQDTRPDAYERAVDRLLASPAYGERRANEWLDLARYADTYGYQSDVERDLSPWRDWVIRSFNENLPFDQFLLWQLAGDLLPNATRDQVLATAFNRLHRQTNEGGSIDEEFRNEYVADRVHTFGTVFLGLTLECARCHDHKYDPIPQRDYYRLAAFFNNIDESGLYSHFTQATPTPTLLLYAEGAAARREQLVRDIRSLESEQRQVTEADRERFGQWLSSGSHLVQPPQPCAAYPLDTLTGEGTPQRNPQAPRALPVDGPQSVPGRLGNALQFSGDNSLVCKGAGAFDRTTPFSFALWLRPAERQDRAVVFHRSRAWSDSGSRGYELVLEQGRPAFALIHFYPGNALKVLAHEPLPTRAWTHLVVTYDGSSQAAGIRLFANGHLLPVQVVRDHLYKDILHRKEWGDADADQIELTLAGRFRDSGFRNGTVDEFEIFDRALTSYEITQLFSRADSLQGIPSPAPPATDQLLEWFLARADTNRIAATSRLNELRREESRLVNDVPEIMVMQEMTPRRPTYVLRRGAYDARGEAVEAGTPSALFPFPDTLPRNRLGLARWLLDPQHPLTARVAVNRVWRTHFGRGLVATAEDFGSQGKLPAHPELLDWLAAWFLNHRWDLKSLHRLVVMSETYQQSSRTPPDLLARDPDNLLLAVGPKRRLQAELIRDSALAISGLLHPQTGGPSVRPYQPAGLWEEAGTGKSYQQGHGSQLYRRSLYTFWKRTAPPPGMLTFDAPTREVCTAKREATTTPLQALVLLNDPQYQEAARVLAEHLVRDFPTDPDSRILRAFRLATSRSPAPPELVVLRQLYREQHQWFQNAPEAARQAIQVGEHPVNTNLPPVEVAATAALTTALINLDEFVTLR